MWSNLLFLLIICNQNLRVRGDFLNGIMNSMQDMGLYYSEHGTSEFYPEAVLTTPEIIRYYGYPAEIHHVVTDDGYILEIHRIPGQRYNSTKLGRKKPVLLQHGIMSSSQAFLMNGIKNSLGFILADESYDVWLGNVRGNIYCLQHTSLSSQNVRFFDYNLDDHGLLDLPAIIDYILKVTGSDKLTYIGHSMGTTIGFYLLAGKPEYNAKIDLAVFMAPVVYGKYVKNPLRIIGTNIKQFTEWYRDLMGTNQIAPFSGHLRKIINSLCSEYPGNIACEAATKILGGYSDQLYDQNRGRILAVAVLAGTSWNVLIHYAQTLIGRRPARFDYGQEINLKKYGQMKPNAYNFSKISTKTVLFHGYMDLFTDPRDVKTLADQLPNLKLKELVPFDTWAHQDFVFAIDVRKHFYERLLQVLKEFQDKS